MDKIKTIDNIFGWLNEITLYKTPVENISEESWEKWNSYMVHRYVSMDIQYIELVNYVQTIPYDNKKQIYQIYREMIPKRKVFLKYLKSNRKKKNTELADYVAKYFECSLGEADEYIDILRDKGVTGILHEMGVDDKEIKKLLKA
jgi:hypothetical protein